MIIDKNAINCIMSNNYIINSSIKKLIKRNNFPSCTLKNISLSNIYFNAANF